VVLNGRDEVQNNSCCSTETVRDLRFLPAPGAFLAPPTTPISKLILLYRPSQQLC